MVARIRHDPSDAMNASCCVERAAGRSRSKHASVASSSIAAQGLVDYLQLVIFSVTGGSGPDRIFANWPDLDLEPVTARGFDGRMQLLEYVPTLHRIGPPPAFWCD